MDGQSARLLAERVVILLFLVAFLDSIGRFLYVGYNEQYIDGLVLPAVWVS